MVNCKIELNLKQPVAYETSEQFLHHRQKEASSSLSSFMLKPSSKLLQLNCAEKVFSNKQCFYSKSKSFAKNLFWPFAKT